MPKHILALVATCAALASCTDGATNPDTEDLCRASDYTSLVGAPLAAVTLPAELNTRILPPGSAMTMDYRPERLNIELDEFGVITRLFCG
ncbi:I78 family peptidase inhibitor [Litorisediminicola beolgyonensis]|uniref:I78 family peptidase inhibitor n=1 Tax=Litorisediminicola beolgyonensis TaxID=1173614 RepID=A0ABW3ZDV7_9RHOB